ncbi:hypothetical protein AXG93_2587s1290 [Marchantia polymorpha subsp. ruderalis]|uniref:histone acetyltransferase n=1 Tax=Marchantia polymorpha subsp. ruderalis TaxID=1480154 RepID=A0A176WRF1_MARPO|nr:hypothetical protein AXG93_2587s1290 [Marchantia polymorpha subsp. ruderalis]
MRRTDGSAPELTSADHLSSMPCREDSLHASGTNHESERIFVVSTRRSRRPDPSHLVWSGMPAAAAAAAADESTIVVTNKGLAVPEVGDAAILVECDSGVKGKRGRWTLQIPQQQKGAAASPGSGQHHMHHQYYQIQQQLLHHHSGSGHGFSVAGGGVSAPGSSVAERPSFVPTTIAPQVTTFIHPPAIAYRPIRPSDLKILQEVHEALFPIKYELEFFSNVVHGHGIISWAAVDTNRSSEKCDELVGFVTARVVAATESEEADMLGYEHVSTERTLIYILTLGVIKQYRNLGIASMSYFEQRFDALKLSHVNPSTP